MMVKKMAGIFSILGVMVFLASWLYFGIVPETSGKAMAAEKAWEVGFYLAIAFFLFGLFVATLGIGLVQEALAETRSRDLERKFRAKTVYDRIVNMDMSPGEALLGEEGMLAANPAEGE